MKRRIGIWLVAGALALGAGIYGLSVPQVVEIQAGEAVVKDISVQIEVSGEVRARDSYNVMSDTGGAIAEVLVQEGDIVEQGQPLIRLDTREIDAQLALADMEYQYAWDKNTEALSAAVQQQQTLIDAQAGLAAGLAAQEALQTALALAQNSSADLQAFNLLMEQASAQEASADMTIDQTQMPSYDVPVNTAELAILKAKADQLRSRKEAMTLRSLLGGKVLHINARKGEVLSPGASAMLIADTETVYVEAEVDEQDIAGIRKGQTALIVDEGRQKSYRGIISSVGEAALPTGISGAAMGSAEIQPQQRISFKTGTHLPVFVEVESAKDVLTIPLECLREDDNGDAYVMKVEGETLVRTPVEAGLTNGTDIEVSGLIAGERVAKDLPDDYREGMRVAVLD